MDFANAADLLQTRVPGLHVVWLGLPKASRESFDLLERAGTLPTELADALRGMVGFRNIAVHDYRSIDLDVVEAIVAKHLDDLLAFARIAVGTMADG